MTRTVGYPQSASLLGHKDHGFYSEKWYDLAAVLKRPQGASKEAGKPVKWLIAQLSRPEIRLAWTKLDSSGDGKK